VYRSRGGRGILPLFINFLCIKENLCYNLLYEKETYNKTDN